MSQLEVDKIIPQSGTTLTIGDSGDTVNFADGTNLSIDTNTLYIDSTNNRVGIANSSPSVALDVTGAANVSGDLTVDTDTFKVDSSSNTVLIRETDSTSWNTSADDLIVGGASSGGMTFHNPTQTNIFFADGTTGNEVSRGRIQYIHSDDSLRFGTSGSGNYVTIDSTGKLGLYTTNPQGRLHIYDFSGSGGFRISRTNDILASNTHITCGNDDTFFTTYGNLRFRTEPKGDGVGGTDRLYISDAGDIGIGTIAPSQKLDVNGSIEVSNGIYIGGTASANKLDDYEEGTWTPALSGHTGVTYTSQYGKYTKIGNICYIHFSIVISNYTGTTGGTLRVGGLPFATGQEGNGGLGGQINRWNGINLGSGYTFVSLNCASSGGTTLDVYQSGDNVNSAYMSPSTFSTTGAMQTSFAYRTT